MRRQRPAYINDGHLQRGGHAQPTASRTRFRRGRTPADAQVGPFHIRIDERRQVTGMDAVLEIFPVHSGQIVVPFFRALFEDAKIRLKGNDKYDIKSYLCTAGGRLIDNRTIRAPGGNLTYL